MKFERMINTVELHTGGEPFRIVTSGVPKFPGPTILQRRGWVSWVSWAKENLDRCASHSLPQAEARSGAARC